MRSPWILIGWCSCLLAACSASDGPACVQPQTCVGDPGAGCHWACVDGECRPLCPPECTLAADCAGRTWTEPCAGHWECQAGSCQAVCDSTGCAVDGDCTGALPCEHGGAWRCQAGACVAECDPPPECTTAEDCQAKPWPLDCAGSWACRGGACVAECDTTCIPEGFPVGEGDACCDGLQALEDCTGPDCTLSQRFCVDCVDGVCDPHESPTNCLADCPQGCEAGEQRYFPCAANHEVLWCECLPDACRPVCQSDASGSEAWIDPCTNLVLKWGGCRQCSALCEAIGDRSEGWYAECGIGQEPALIVYAPCAPRWSCPLDPPDLCN